MLRFRTFFAFIIFIVILTAGVYSQPTPEDSFDPSAFYGGRADKTVLQADIKVYRTYGGSTEQPGGWYTLSPPTWAQKAKNELALPLTNAATHYAEVVIPKGTTIYLGTAARQPFSPSARGGGPQIWVGPGARDGLKTVKTDIPVPQTWWSRSRSLDSYLPKTYREAWAAYAQTPPRQPAGFVPDRVVPQFTTDKSRISEAVKSYGTFPGGILLEANARFSSEALRRLNYDSASNTFQVNNRLYDPGLEQEEIAILHHFVSHSEDTKHFGAVSQDKFHGVPEDSIVTLWLSIADSELGGYAYGYDLATEIFYPPEELGYTNPELLHLAQIAEMNLAVIEQDMINTEVFEWQPRIFLRSRDVTFRLDENNLSVDRHSLDVNFQVFREYGNEKNIEYSLNDAKQAEPHVADSIKWVSDNLPAVLKSSPALSRVMRYGEVLALFRYASQHGLNVENASDLEAAYNQRKKIPMTSDVYADIGADYSAHVRATSLLLESKFRNESESLNPLGRLVVMMELMKLASISSDASQLARYRQEAIPLLALAREFDKTFAADQRYAPEVFEAIESFIKETQIRSIFNSAYYADEYLKNKNLEPALAFLTTASEACSEVIAGAIETELYSKTCSDVAAKLAQNKQAEPSNETTTSTPKIINSSRNIVILTLLGAAILLVVVFFIFRHRVL